VLLQKMPSSIVLLFGRNNAAASVTRVVKLGNNSVENLATLRGGVTYKNHVVLRRRRAGNAGETDLFPLKWQSIALLRWEVEQR
jgi:hypothetical protein